MRLEFSGEVVYWRGPAPWHFIVVPAAECDALADISPEASYGWGCIPVTATVDGTEWTTSLFPKDGGYLLPVRTAVRRTAQIDLGDIANVSLTVSQSSRP